jgi:hypothetical protein
MYSDMIVKFCVCQPRSIKATVPTHLVFEDGVDAQHVKGIALRLLAAVPPLLLLGARQILRRVDIAGLPLAVDLALELGSPLRLDHLGRLRGAVEAGVAREPPGRKAAVGALAALLPPRIARRASSGRVQRRPGGAAEQMGGLTLLLGARREASQTRARRRDGGSEGQPC